MSEFAKWYWHLSMVQFHEDSGAQLPVPINQAKKLTEAVLRQEVWPEWLHYAVNVSEPLVIHAFIPYRTEAHSSAPTTEPGVASDRLSD